LRCIAIIASFLLPLSLWGQNTYEIKVDSLNKIVDEKATNNEFRIAVKAQQQLVNLHKSEKGENSGAFLAASANLALLYQYNNQHKKAVKVLTDILPIYTDRYGNEDEDLPKLYQWLSLSYIKLMRYSEAVKTLQKSVTFFNTYPSKRDKNYYNALNNISLSFRNLGMYDSSVFYSKMAFDYTEETEEKNSYSLSFPATNLGLAYMDLGNYSKAEEYLKLSQNIILKHKGTKNTKYAKVMLNLGLLYKKTYNYKTAIEYYVLCLSTLEGINKTKTREYSSALTNLAIVFRSKGEYRKSINYLWQGLEIREELYSEKSILVAKSYMGLGIAYDSEGMKDSAIWCYTKSAEIEEALSGNSIEKQLRVLHKKALINILKKNYTDAIALYEKKQQLIEANYGAYHQDFSKTLSTLAFLYVADSEPKAATTTLIKAIQAKREYLKSIFTYLPQDELSTYLTKQAYDDNELAAVLLSKNDNSKLKTALLNNMLFLKGAVLKNNSDVFSAIRYSGNDKLLHSYNRYVAIQKKIGEEYNKPQKNRSTNIDSLTNEAKELEKLLIKQSSQYRDLNTLFETNWKDIQNKLKPNEAAIEFIRFTKLNEKGNEGEWYAALIVKKEYKEPEFIVLCAEKEIKNILTKVPPKSLFAKRGNELLGEVENTTNYDNDLYQLIWKKIEPYVDNCKKVYHSPDGILHQVAFNALPVNDSTLLINKHQLIRLLSLRSLLDRYAVKQLQSIALFGGLKYDNDAAKTVNNAYSNLPDDRNTNTSFTFLQGTLAEVERIRRLTKNGTELSFYSGAEGTEENFKQMSGNSPQVIHLATHGFFITKKKSSRKRAAFNENTYATADNPLMRGGLILSGGNDAWKGLPTPEGKEDGVLTAYEVSNLDLSKTQFVVLSACQTGLGEVQETEGVYGLQRAFKMAGVKQIIMSLWSVPDKETKELMEIFYKIYIETNNPRRALYGAQAAMRNKYPPYYWAAFVLVE
jgi:CHAT domain-containing protein